MTIANPWLLLAGLVTIAVGYALRSWASRHNLLDVATDAALSTAWTTIRTRKAPSAVPEEISSRVNDITSEASHVGKATKVAGYAFRHVVATAVGIAGLIIMLIGLILAGLGVFWSGL